MSRPIRIEFPDALYHVTARGDRREDIFEDDQDRQMFLTQTTDRRGKTTRYSYDNDDRISHLEDADGRTTDYSYDPVGRITHIADSISGDILLQYGILNSPTRIITDQGTLDYQYDQFGRRTQMRVNGGDTVDYAYDIVGRLTRTGFRGKDAGYAFDAAGRLTQKTLPNGTQQNYSYDQANRLLSIEYKKADGSPIETINYSYDANGNVAVKEQGVDSAPETPFSAQYDNGNRLTQITFHPGSANAASYDLAYDAAGYLVRKSHSTDTTDVTTYTWDAKGRLASLAGPNLQASYRYDALGRRIEKTVNGQSVGYLYDGSQAIAELVGSSVTAAYHPGVQIDEILARYTAAGEKSLLQDALGSVIAQTAEDGSTTNRYTYSPYGESQAIGPDEGNPLQYTGRENDGTGLYYYRARYYDPMLKRFISEDPIGLAGGINLYTYVKGNPLSYTDPLGLWPFGMPGKGDAQQQLPGVLQSLVPSLTPSEASQLSKDVIDKAGWGDVADVNAVTPDILHTPQPSKMDDLSAAQQALLKNFLDKLPSRDKDAANKVKNACTK
jgi:RHS repeat-associated protein